MRNYSETEICLLLLCALPVADPSLRESRYRKMMRMLEAVGIDGTDPNTELDEEALLRLGCTVEEARGLIHRLSQRDALGRYLHNLERKGITLVTRISHDYPQRLRSALGDRAPLVLWCSGNTGLFSKTCVSLVGSRQLRPAGEGFSRDAGMQIAKMGAVYCSGGAKGADTVGLEAAVMAGGSAIIFIADSLLHYLNKPLYYDYIRDGKLLLVSEGGFDEVFSAHRALSRNRLIHAMGEKTLVAQADYGTGGTWNGTVENLKNRWSPVFVCNEEPGDPGTKGLLERGGIPVRKEELSRLSDFRENQLSFL